VETGKNYIYIKKNLIIRDENSCDGEGIILHIQKKKKNNIGTPIDIEEAIIHRRCHFSHSSSRGSNRKTQEGC
jgi:hypothetical protein